MRYRPPYLGGFFVGQCSGSHPRITSVQSCILDLDKQKSDRNSERLPAKSMFMLGINEIPMSDEMSGEMSGGMSDETLAVTEDVGCVGSSDTSLQLKQMRSVRQKNNHYLSVDSL